MMRWPRRKAAAEPTETTATGHELTVMVDEIVGYKKRTRWLRWGTLGLAVVALALAIFVGIQNNAIRDQADALHSAQLANCAVSNGIKAKELTLWHNLFALSAANNAASHQKVPPSTAKFLAEFLHDVAVTFQPLDCAKAYPDG
jgi:hypothetical protein